RCRCAPRPPPPPSLPTRRSSDLGPPNSAILWGVDRVVGGEANAVCGSGRAPAGVRRRGGAGGRNRSRCPRGPRGAGAVDSAGGRSEEHTSELESRENLVCRLLLE